MDFVAIAQHALRVCLASVDHEQDRIVQMRKRQTVEQVAQCTPDGKHEVETAQRPTRRGSLQGGVQMDGDREVYQLNMLSRSASDAS